MRSLLALKKACLMAVFLIPPLMGLSGCGATSGLYGPAYVPQCTCCCGGGYAPYSYHQSNHSSLAGAPLATTMLHDTKGPMTDTSSNGKSVRHRGKAHR